MNPYRLAYNCGPHNTRIGTRVSKTGAAKHVGIILNIRPSPNSRLNFDHGYYSGNFQHDVLIRVKWDTGKISEHKAYALIHVDNLRKDLATKLEELDQRISKAPKLGSEG